MWVYGPQKHYNLSRVPNFCRVIYMSKKINIYHLFMNLDVILASVKPWYWGNVYLHGYTTTTKMTLCGDANSWEVHECLARGEASLPNVQSWFGICIAIIGCVIYEINTSVPVLRILYCFCDCVVKHGIWQALSDEEKHSPVPSPSSDLPSVSLSLNRTSSPVISEQVPYLISWASLLLQCVIRLIAYVTVILHVGVVVLTDQTHTCWEWWLGRWTIANSHYPEQGDCSKWSCG